MDINLAIVQPTDKGDPFSTNVSGICLHQLHGSFRAGNVTGIRFRCGNNWVCERKRRDLRTVPNMQLTDVAGQYFGIRNDGAIIVSNMHCTHSSPWTTVAASRPGDSNFKICRLVRKSRSFARREYVAVLLISRTGCLCGKNITHKSKYAVQKPRCIPETSLTKEVNQYEMLITLLNWRAVKMTG